MIADITNAPPVFTAPKRLTFRSSRIIYYGPHACGNCGVTICKMGHEWGGNAFTYPEGHVYPNTEWHPHVCDPKMVERQDRMNGIPARSVRPRTDDNK